MRVRLTAYLFVVQALAITFAVAPTPRHIAEKSAAGLPAQLIDGEKSSWLALQRQDKNAWESLVSIDYAHVSSTGTLLNREGALKIFSDDPIDRYALHHLRGTLICADVFLVTYVVERKAAHSAGDYAATFVSSALWAKRNEGWLKVRYQETPVVATERLSGSD
jgi:hypothetical protein